MSEPSRPQLSEASIQIKRVIINVTDEFVGSVVAKGGTSILFLLLNRKIDGIAEPIKNSKGSRCQ